LGEKMVFLGGPRQVGKSTLALSLIPAADETHPAYLSWDVPEHQRLLVKGGLPAEQRLLILDEVHKYKRWRNLIKGVYDRHKSRTRFLITGSARLDHYRRGGDSLQGRYHYYRLHPLSLHELNDDPRPSDLEILLRFGGFPEPFLKQDNRHWRRWQRERTSRVIQEDLISLESVREVSQLQLLAQMLPERVGSVLSIANLRKDLSVAFETADKWVGIFENLYYCFRIMPYGLPHLRAGKKERKLYLWDWSLCENEAARECGQALRHHAAAPQRPAAWQDRQVQSRRACEYDRRRRATRAASGPEGCMTSSSSQVASDCIIGGELI
jgi:uncharacterized protein